MRRLCSKLEPAAEVKRLITLLQESRRQTATAVAEERNLQEQRKQDKQDLDAMKMQVAPHFSTLLWTTLSTASPMVSSMLTIRMMMPLSQLMSPSVLA